jgi:hypothetical protein
MTDTTESSYRSDVPADGEEYKVTVLLSREDAEYLLAERKLYLRGSEQPDSEEAGGIRAVEIQLADS